MNTSPESSSIEIVEADLSQTPHQKAIVELIDAYAHDPMGNGCRLPEDVKEALIPGTLTRAYNIGRAIREARESGADPVAAAVAAVEGWHLFTGTVSKRETEDREGYYWGINTIAGTDKFKGNTMKIFFKNENHVTWLDDQVYVTSPDVIEVVDLKTAEPITNTDLREGDSVAVIGAKNEAYRSKEGIALIGPKHYGYDIEYVPIENRVK